MGFREFFINRSRQHIDGLVQRLLDERTVVKAMKELSTLGAAAVASLTSALSDERFRQAERPSLRDPSPLSAVLELLVPYAAEHVMATAMPLVDSTSDEARKAAALHLASLGRKETLPVLAKLLQDANGCVRSRVCIGIQRAVEASRVEEAFRRGAYDLLLEQCGQKWKWANNNTAETIVALDPTRAVVDFASPRWLSAGDPHTEKIIGLCNRTCLALPEKIVRDLLEHSLPLATGDRCYPHQYIAAAALEALAIGIGERARPLLEAQLTNEDSQIQEGAALGIVRLAGLADPIGFVFERIEQAGFDGLTPPQRVVYCAFLFDAEVCNGGIMQFLGNSSGNHTAETLEALRLLGHPEAETALTTAMKLVGPLAREPDRNMRLTAFEDRYDQLKAAFDPLEQAYYKTHAQLRQRALLYAAKHPEHFRG